MDQLNPDGPVVVASLIALVLFGGIWLLFAVPYLRGVVTGLRGGSWWSLFERNAQGRYGVLAGSRFFASFRAPEPDRRTRAGLLTRWIFWAVVLVGLGWYPLSLVLRLVAVGRST